MNEIKSNNVDLYYLMRLALDSDVFHFDEIYCEKENTITLLNYETQTKLIISLKGVTEFEARIKSKYFYKKEVKNYQEYINFIQSTNIVHENKFLLN